MGGMSGQEPPKVEKEIKTVWLHTTTPQGQVHVVGPLNAFEHDDPILERKVLVAVDGHGNPHVFVEVDHRPDEPKDIWWAPVHQTWVRISDLPGGIYHEC